MANRDSFDDFETDDQDDGFLTFDARDEEEDRSRGPLVIAAIVAVLLICGVILWQLYAGSRGGDETPQVASDTAAIKTAPADTGGAETADTDKGVFDDADGGASPPLDVLPTIGADDPMLADADGVPAAPVSAAPAQTAPAKTAPPPARAAVPAPPPRREVAVVQPKPKPVVVPVAKAAPVKVAQVTPPPRPVAVPKIAVAAPASAPAAVAAAPKAAAPTPSASSRGISAQLGSFQTRASADTALAQYKSSGLSGSVSIVAADLGAKGTWYRIRATGFDTKGEVDSFCSKARSAGAQCIPSSR
jgi:cell division protein FtsN